MTSPSLNLILSVHRCRCSHLAYWVISPSRALPVCTLLSILENVQMACATGPVLLEDYEVQEKLSSLNRERIPERVVHAKGAVAKGYFEVYAPISL